MSQIDPIKAVVTAGEGPFTDFVSRHPDATERNAYLKSLDFELILGNGEVYPQKGKFYALDRSLDPKTGSIRYYVTFPNPGDILRPGQFGNVRFVADMKKGAMVVPQEAVNELQGSYQVAVVDQNNKVSIRPVKMGERIGAMWEVTEGLKPGDKVVVQGLQKAREGSTVTVKEWTPPADALVSQSGPAQRSPNTMSEFFVRRPIVAIVIAILMTLIGGVCILALPIAQYPQIAPPEIQVQTHYTGADALTIEQSVAAPIEQQMSGVDNMNYMYSINANSGDIRLIVNFDVATDPNIDHVLTQLRVSQAQSQLPADVNNYGVTVKKSTTAPLMLVALYSPKGSYDGTFLANYAYINLVDQLTRVPGIGNVQIFGAGQYAMRLWVKPDQLAKLGITVPDIITAVQKQNTVNPAGQVGGEPIPSGQKFTYTVRAQGRLQTPEEFGEIVVRANPDGSFVRVKDIARIDLGAQTYNLRGRLNGQPSAIIAVYQLPGTNAVKAAQGVRKLMAEAKQRFPADMDFAVSLDQTLSVTEGLREIVKDVVRGARAGRRSSYSFFSKAGAPRSFRCARCRCR